MVCGNTMNVAIIGSRRKRSGIGEYIARYFHRNGATVTAVLGTTAESASAAAAALRQYGIAATGHCDFRSMAENALFDAIAIASPAATHHDYLIRSIEAGAHIFCEKPFLCAEGNELEELLEHIFTLAAAKNLTIAMNSQWPFSLPCYEELCGSIDPLNADRFFIHLSPACTGREMIIEAVPHALSILYAVFGSGTIIAPEVHALQEDQMIIDGEYRARHSRLSIRIELRGGSAPPRRLAFGFNGMIVERRLHLDNYDIFFNYATRTRRIADPLDLSVRDFLAAVREGREPLIGKSHIMNTTLLLRNLYAGCASI